MAHQNSLIRANSRLTREWSPSHYSRISGYSSGEYGMGTQANELSLGCDCLGQIHYLVRIYDRRTV